jgi:hypothetical protein
VKNDNIQYHLQEEEEEEEEGVKELKILVFLLIK